MLGQVELIERRVGTQLALELGLRSHLLELAVDERPILHVLLERGLGLVLAEHHERVHVVLGMEGGDVRAHVRQAVGARAAVRTQVRLPAVTHQVAVVARRARRLVAAEGAAPYLGAEAYLIGAAAARRRAVVARGAVGHVRRRLRLRV